MEGKKISFGFMKTKKAEKPVVEEKKDFIECLEEKSIKVVGGEQAEEEKPLVIPMKPNTLITAERLKQIAEKVESGLDEVLPMKQEPVEVEPEPAENETLDQMAVRELLQEAKKEVKVETQELTVPIPSIPVIEGQKESTLEDYEAVPVQDFGMAMLRGMGWTPNKEQLAKHKQPELRPKGLGLGADKVISDKQKKKTSNKDGKEEELSIVKNSYVKIIAGKHSGYYGKVVSLDEDNGRVMVDITIKKETVSLSEFMMQAVTKAEFDKESKVINTNAYEEYKKREMCQDQSAGRKESPKVTERANADSPKSRNKEPSSSQKSNDRRDLKEDRRKDYDYASNGRSKKRQERSRKDYSSDEDNRKKKDNKRDFSSSEDRSNRRRKEKSRRDSSSSEERSRRRQKYETRSDLSSEDRSRRKEKDKKKYSSNESLDSISDTEKRRKHKKNKDSSDSESESRKKDKRDIDKKRKGKKKKRDRDRSPNYKKHRK